MNIILLLSIFIGVFLNITPSSITKIKVINISKTMQMQISKIDPAKLAFNEVYSNYLNENQNSNNILQITNENKKNENLNLVISEQQQDPIVFLRKLKKDKMILSTMSVKLSEPPVQFNHNFDSEIGKLVSSERIQNTFATTDKNESIKTGNFLNIKNNNDQSFDAGKIFNNDGSKKGNEITYEGPVKISGPIEFGYDKGKGLPWGPGYHLDVKRIENSVNKESGTIDIVKNIYQIQVTDWSGVIVARLTDDSGRVLGEGSFRLLDGKKLNSKNQIGEPIIVKPINDGLNITYKELSDASKSKGHSNVTASMASNGGLQEIDKKTNNETQNKSTSDENKNGLNPKILDSSYGYKIKKAEDGQYFSEGLSASSWTMIRSQQKEFYEQLQLIPSGEASVINLFRTTFVEALKKFSIDQILKSTNKNKNGSVLWGQVKSADLYSGNKGISGVTVVVENFEDYPVIYLNELMLPDPNLKTTSSNGYFLVFDLPEGIQHILAKWKNQYFGHINAIIDSDTLSSVEIKKTIEHKAVDIRVYDAFTQQPLSASVTLQSYAENLEINGSHKIYTEKVRRLSFAEVISTDKYSKAIYDYDDMYDFIYLPLVQKQWLQYLSINEKIVQSNEMGVFVGFVPDEDYVVDEILINKTAKIVYFDSKGNITENGIAGGGFAIFNLEPGALGVTIKAMESNRRSSKVVTIDSENLFVTLFSF